MLKLSDLRTALADKAKLSEDLATALAKITSLEADILAANSKAEAFSLEISEANTLIESLNGKVATLEGEKKTVADATIETIAELGIAAKDLPKSTGTVVDDKAIYEQYSALTGREKTAFYRENRAALKRFASEQK